MNNQKSLKQSALDLYDSGLCILPAKDKKPFGGLRSWDEFKGCRPTREQVAEWFSNPSVRQIFIVCGRVSGNVFCFDLDWHNGCLELPFEARLEKSLVQRLVKERTQHGGLHYIGRLKDRSDSTQKLAKEFSGKVYDNGLLGTDDFVETRFEKAGFVCSASDEYELLQGSLLNIPTVTNEEYESLITAGKALDKRKAQMASVLEREKRCELREGKFEARLLEKAKKGFDSLTSPVCFYQPLHEVTHDNLPERIEQEWCTADDYFSMEPDEQKDFLKDMLELYLQAKGIDPAKPFYCPDKTHVTQDPHTSLEPTDKQFCKCWSHPGGACNFDIFEIIKLDYTLKTFDEAKHKLLQLLGFVDSGTQSTIPDKDDTIMTDKYKQEYTSEEELRRHQEDPHTFSKWASRGLTEATVNKFSLGYDSTQNALILPYNEGGFTRRYLSPTAPEKYKKNNTVGFFNSQAIFEGDCIVITEGEIDAISVEQNGCPSVGVGGVKFVTKFVEWLKTLPKEFTAEKVFVAGFDNDEPGRRDQKLLVKAMREAQFNVLEYNICGDFKDANEALLKAPEEFCKQVELASEPVRLKQIVRKQYVQSKSLLGFDDELQKGLTDPNANKALPTGLSGVDSLLGGGIRNELTVLGAISSLGKTTLCQQIVENFAMQGRDVLFISLEMSTKVLYFKSLVRLAEELYQKNKSTSQKKVSEMDLGRVKLDGTVLTVQDLQHWAENHQLDNFTGSVDNFRKTEESKRLNQVIDVYRCSIAPHMFIIEGEDGLNSKTIRSLVEDHVANLGTSPVVLIDYVQILGDWDDKLDYRKSLDKNISELKRISRDFDTPVIAISSLSRGSYFDRVALSSFKESGNIEFGSDMLVGLQLLGIADCPSNTSSVGRNLQHAIADAVADVKKTGGDYIIDYCILKDRNGAGGSTNLTFNPRIGTFRDATDEDCKNWIKRVWKFLPSNVRATEPTYRSWIEQTLRGCASDRFLEELELLSQSKSAMFDEDEAVYGIIGGPGCETEEEGTKWD